jgi:hypothetical protein
MVHITWLSSTTRWAFYCLTFHTFLECMKIAPIFFHLHNFLHNTLIVIIIIITNIHCMLIVFHLLLTRTHNLQIEILRASHHLSSARLWQWYPKKKIKRKETFLIHSRVSRRRKVFNSHFCKAWKGKNPQLGIDVKYLCERMVHCEFKTDVASSILHILFIIVNHISSLQIEFSYILIYFIVAFCTSSEEDLKFSHYPIFHSQTDCNLREYCFFIF